MASVKELLNLSSRDISKLSRRELALVVSQLASAGNKRLRRLENTSMGTESIPYKNTMKVGKFSVAGKNQGQLQNEFKRVSEFLKTKTSTVSGWKEEKARVYKRIGGRFDSEDAEKAFWRAYRVIAKSEKALHKSYGSTETQRYLRKEQSNAKQLTSEEIERYKELFPDDRRELSNISQLDLSVVRTLIEMGEDYESQEKLDGGRYGGNAGFFKIGGSNT